MHLLNTLAVIWVAAALAAYAGVEGSTSEAVAAHDAKAPRPERERRAPLPTFNILGMYDLTRSSVGVGVGVSVLGLSCGANAGLGLNGFGAGVSIGSSVGGLGLSADAGIGALSGYPATKSSSGGCSRVFDAGSDYSAVFYGDFAPGYSGSIGGRLAVGGYFKSSAGFSIGGNIGVGGLGASTGISAGLSLGLPCSGLNFGSGLGGGSSLALPDMVVRSGISWTGGSLCNGRGHLMVLDQSSRIVDSKTSSCSHHKFSSDNLGKAFDFDYHRDVMSALSLDLSLKPATLSLDYVSAGTAALKVLPDAGGCTNTQSSDRTSVEVLNVSPAFWTLMPYVSNWEAVVRLSSRPGCTLIINMLGAAPTEIMSGNFKDLSGASSRIIWNYPEATSGAVHIHAPSGFYGSVVAPRAIIAGGGNFNGQVYAHGFQDLSSLTINQVTFNGNLPHSRPAPLGSKHPVQVSHPTCGADINLTGNLDWVCPLGHLFCPHACPYHTLPCAHGHSPCPFGCLKTPSSCSHGKRPCPMGCLVGKCTHGYDPCSKSCVWNSSPCVHGHSRCPIGCGPLSPPTPVAPKSVGTTQVVSQATTPCGSAGINTCRTASTPVTLAATTVVTAKTVATVASTPVVTVPVTSLPSIPSDPCIAAATILSSGHDYNAVVYGNMVVPSADTEGRLAVGGNLVISGTAGYSVGYKLQDPAVRCDSSSASSLPALVCGGQVHYPTGQIYNGNIMVRNGVTQNISSVVTAGLQYYGCGVKSVDSIQLAATFDFVTHQATMISYSQALNTMLPTLVLTSVADSTAAIEVVGSTSSRPRIEVLEISPSMFKTVPAITGWASTGLVQNSDGILVVNFKGTSPTTFSGQDWTALKPYGSRIIWNYADAVSVSIKAVSLPGLVLAPASDLTSAEGELVGQIIVGSVTSTTEPIQFSALQFQGCLPV